MKRLSILLLAVLLFTGCYQAPVIQEPPATHYDYLAPQSEIFPFYCIGEDNKLWRVERSRASLIDVTVNYFPSGQEKGFVKYIREKDTVIFATDITVENGNTVATLSFIKGTDAPEKIAEKIKLDTLRVLKSGDLLYIDTSDTLFLRRNGNLMRIEENVQQAEFADEETFLFRLKNGTNVDGEILYPIYSSTGEYRNLLMEGLEIASADHSVGRAYIIKNKHTVTKRASSVTVADVCVFYDGAIIFEIPSAVLSLVCENRYGFIVSCNEDEKTLVYDLYYTGNTLPVKKAEGIIAGRYVSQINDVFAYESYIDGKVKTSVINGNGKTYTYDLGSECSLENVYYSSPYTYVFINGSVRLLENGKIKKTVATDIRSVRLINEGLLCFRENTPPYSVSLLVGEEMKNTAGNVQTSDVIYRDGYLYYYTGDGSELNVVDGENNSTALISNVDSSLGFITNKGTAAIIKKNDGTLYIVAEKGITNTSLKIKKFVSEV
jgi:hypothetical protein